MIHVLQHSQLPIGSFCMNGRLERPWYFLYSNPQESAIRSLNWGIISWADLKEILISLWITFKQTTDDLPDHKPLSLYQLNSYIFLAPPMWPCVVLACDNLPSLLEDDVRDSRTRNDVEITIVTAMNVSLTDSTLGSVSILTVGLAEVWLSQQHSKRQLLQTGIFIVWFGKC